MGNIGYKALLASCSHFYWYFISSSVFDSLLHASAALHLVSVKASTDFNVPWDEPIPHQISFFLYLITFVLLFCFYLSSSSFLFSSLLIKHIFTVSIRDGSEPFWNSLVLTSNLIEEFQSNQVVLDWVWPGVWKPEIKTRFEIH